MKLKSFFLAFLLVFSLPLFSQSYSDYSNAELIQMLEQELNKQEQLVNQQKEQLTNLQEQLNKQVELNKILNEQMNNLQLQLSLANQSYQNSKKGNLKTEITIGSICFFGGFFASSMIVYFNK